MTETKVSSNAASKVVYALNFTSWKEMIGEPIVENTSKKQNDEMALKVEILKKKVKVLEKQIAQISAQIGLEKGRTKRNV